MRFNQLWLLVSLPLGFSASFRIGQGLTAALDQQCSAQVERQPVYAAAPTSSGTIYQVLSDDPKFSRVVKAINFVEDVVSLLDDSSVELTFFAPPDQALHHPDHPHKLLPPIAGERPEQTIGSYSRLKASIRQDIKTTGNVDEFKYISEFKNLEDAIELLDQFEALSNDDDGDDKKCKEILKFILRAVLHYHIIPESHDVHELTRNTTYPTKLTIPGASDGQPLRLRVSQSVIPPFTAINFFVRVSHPNIKANNGIIHVVNHPIIPPPSVFQELYLAPRHFSTLTSALQRSELTTDVDLRYVHGKGFAGASLVTVFAPTNRAFKALPMKLQLFLFSPIGERILKKILQYHIVPDIVVHSNFVHHTKAHDLPDEAIAYFDAKPQIIGISDSNMLFDIEERKWPVFSLLHSGLTRRGERKPHVEPVFSTNLTLDTLFVNHTLRTHISQHKINFPFPGPKRPSIIDTKVFVNHHPVVAADVVSLNGVVHVIDRLLDPRKGKGHHGHHHHHEKSSRVRKYDDDCHDRSHDDRHHHKHHHKHHKHHKHEETDVYAAEYDDVWSDWESWLIKWADEQD
ncbi:Fasciclin-like arabinogalactan protein [Psilocybe cubensis]|uniref:Fasciclin-like arabinogalactan protein n=1 Tax=Psilocybe cubensis TaxID=181762 RepID=A0ACB8H8R8_PSICU|nr:Fasciclin-like arabinogalactan protein [Psilocybe cubensis]KAH9484198.1 Fasciclin-like arabinogalactan protein [Psilocybe cubensis]